MSMPSDDAIEALHLNLQINQEQTQDLVFTRIGHVSGVDPTTNRIKVVIPTWTNDNETSIESGWIPLGSPVSGNQFGIQLLPFGGAAVDDLNGEKSAKDGNTPQAEQVLVHVLGRKRAFYVTGVQMYNQVDVPPSGYQDKSGIQAAAGEWLYKHSSGGYLYFANDNNIDLISYTNPAPVVQTNKHVDKVTHEMNVGIKADGGNASTSGGQPSKVESTFNLTNTTTGGETNNATTAETITSESKGDATKTLDITADDSQGTAQYNVTIKSHDSTMSITIQGDTNTYTLDVPNGTINLNAKDINITGTETTTITGGKDTIVLGG